MDKDTLKLFCIIFFIFLALFGALDLVWYLFGETVVIIIGVVASIVYILFGFTIFAKSLSSNQ